jgi:hypothetical protein
MGDVSLQKELAKRLKALDRKQISPPIEIAVGDYAFYPYRGFNDITGRDDFRKLSQNQLRTLIKITEDILEMERPELFEAFVNDDGIIVVDKAQPHVEYSIDISYNDARSRVEEIFPQVTYPQGVRAVRLQDKFIRNDTAHEVAHHADFWIDVERRGVQLEYLHSSSVLLVWLEELDLLLRPQGVAHLITQVRDAEGYVAESLLSEGYTPKKIDQMLRAEFFAIAGEFYYGSKQRFADRSPLLEAYMTQVLDLDLEIQRLYISFADMEKRRKILREAIHAPVNVLLGTDADAYRVLREKFDATKKYNEKLAIAEEIESLVMHAMARVLKDVRSRIKLPKAP